MSSKPPGPPPQPPDPPAPTPPPPTQPTSSNPAHDQYSHGRLSGSIGVWRLVIGMLDLDTTPDKIRRTAQDQIAALQDLLEHGGPPAPPESDRGEDGSVGNFFSTPQKALGPQNVGDAILAGAEHCERCGGPLSGHYIDSITGHHLPCTACYKKESEVTEDVSGDAILDPTNLCVHCKGPLGAHFYGAGDGRGQWYACAKCYEERCP